MFNGRIYFIGALYHVRGQFSHLPKFVRRFADELNKLPYERQAVLTKVQQLREQYESVSEPITEKDALHLMLAADLSAIEQAILNPFIANELEQRKNIDSFLNACKDRGIELLRDIRVNTVSPEIFTVDMLPPPYTGQNCTALNVDMGDYKNYHITPGIYFPNNRLRPFFSEFSLFHELIHVVFARKNPELITRGLEEGLAELIGSMYLSSKILGKELTTNLFIYNRLSDQLHQYWELYMDATRQATLLYQRFGLKGLAALLNKGREELKRVEWQCVRMKFDEIDLPSGEYDKDLTDIADFLSLAFNRNLVVSPLAKYLSQYVRPQRTVRDILSESRVEREAGKRALKELEDRVYLASYSNEYTDFDDAVVIWTDCDWLSTDGSVIRYEIPE